MMIEQCCHTTGHTTLQRGSSVGKYARLEPGEPSSATGHTTLQRGNSVGKYARLEPGEPSSEPGNELRWHDRGYMPHVDGQELIQHVTFHLADSLPKEAIQRMADETKSLPPKLRNTEKEKRIAAYLDAGRGRCVLKDPPMAELVQNALLIFHEQRYQLHAWCIMPNHVHVLFQTMKGWSMSQIVASWKSFTGRRISAYLKEKEATLERGEPGSASATLERGEPSGEPSINRIWHREYWDRYIRDHAHYVNTVNYIHLNPVKAGLVEKAELWRWSSAFKGARLEPGEPRNDATLERGEPS